MGKELPARETAMLLHPVEAADHLRVVEVEGDLSGAAGQRWTTLLRGAVEQRAEGIAVDLRGCDAIDGHCLEALLAAAATLKARGGSGVVLVMRPGSPLSRDVRLLAGEELAILDTADAALLALGHRRMPLPALATVEQEHGMAVIAVNGELDLAVRDEFRAALDQALALEAPLIVDLEHCSFIDSSGIGLILRAYRLTADRGYGLVAPGPQVHRVLDLVGIPEHLPTFDSRADAIDALSQWSRRLGEARPTRAARDPRATPW
jgi:anti-anti-sigma factor